MIQRRGGGRAYEADYLIRALADRIHNSDH